ncbi:hypothetical protein MGG_05021 [Pyricularia oryzae 70-15]|uniref:Deacetylase-like protein n=1 Tax=Pyricularia oryzae (strain 70-15 / ATCC MYA-4617 / FGSC 8958) TaxID=242507 RepID=G4N3U7_PYRO7|nr:uncharacterized protein MGG_05021 [Pyricularia oryzae 70-15]EHA52720.1 hypothetical protein MGG_05021 [Pyricularia oryzae 70-15]
MARKRKADPVKIELKQPDRSGPSDKTLLDIASERNLFRQADEKQRENDLKKHGWSAVAAADTTEEGEAESLSPQAERILDTLLWGVSLAMLHFTFDVLVQNQFAMEITWPKVFTRAFQALLGNIKTESDKPSSSPPARPLVAISSTSPTNMPISPS